MRRVWILVLVPFLTILAAVISAQDADTDPKDPRNSTEATPNVDRERLALDFVRSHHEELVELLGSLRATNPDEYNEAIRELFRAQENFVRIRRRDPDRAALMLETWKAGSRVQLLAARLMSKTNAPREAELRQALTDQLAAQLAVQKYDRAQLRKRLEQLDASIRKHEERADAVIESRLNAVRKKVQRVRRQAEKAEQAPSASPPVRTQGEPS
ncbi:hypothetical protein [Tautonia rosea]|uniref:hypothetical protein n=1 Tax=Tautonia rosea TaxID=2728037 RepID=UPI001472D048|nr:hypothetical protein [Tautonia rosea]